MDRTSEDYYKFFRKIFPYLLIGFMLSLLVNILMLNVMQAVSPSSLGFPLKSGKVIDRAIQFEILGFLGNLVIWTIAFSVVIPFLQFIFFPKRTDVSPPF
jgi:hypothetical protein